VTPSKNFLLRWVEIGAQRLYQDCLSFSAHTLDRFLMELMNRARALQKLLTNMQFVDRISKVG
jgi:hypothetical protein